MAVALVSALLMAAPATAAKFVTKKQVKKKYYTKAQADTRYPQRIELATSDGNAPNQGSNLVHWNNLAGVPPGFADGTDDTGEAAPPAWLLAGNAGTDPDTQFVGTTDDQALSFRVNDDRALRLEPDATSPNVIGGFSENEVSTSGATIGGGGQAGFPNTVTGDFGTVGGGLDNTAGGGTQATVGGGEGNTASGSEATVGGGDFNTASGGASTVGGGVGNTADASGATVGGGGANTSSSERSTVGGGDGNTASGDRSTVGGGADNTASSERSTVGGGSINTAGGFAATVGGGANNTATGTQATVGGGRDNQVTAPFGTIGGGAPSNLGDVANTRNIVTDEYGTVGGGGDNQAGNAAGSTTDSPFATVGGGDSNTASGDQSTVGGGRDNTASALQATVGGGVVNIASAQGATVGGGLTNNATSFAATVGGGDGNFASGVQSTVPGGRGGLASLHGQMAHASGLFSAFGDAQTSEFVLRQATTNDTPTELFLDGTDDRLTLGSGRTFSFEALIVARTANAGGESAGYRVTGLIENVGGATAFVGSPTVTVLGEDNPAWDLTVEADDPNNALVLEATGVAATTIRWVAMVQTAEVLFE